jgi:hypothetical protein
MEPGLPAAEVEPAEVSIALDLLELTSAGQ